MLKHILITASLVATAITPAIAAPMPNVYMGKASTGEAVYYRGARAQCGDLPQTDECWKNPAVAYTIGLDSVFAIPDCRRGVFKEVWVGSRLVNRNMRPQSEAIQKVLSLACASAR